MGMAILAIMHLKTWQTFKVTSQALSEDALRHERRISG
jgi:hypothetical protein